MLPEEATTSHTCSRKQHISQNKAGMHRSKGHRSKGHSKGHTACLPVAAQGPWGWAKQKGLQRFLYILISFKKIQDFLENQVKYKSEVYQPTKESRADRLPAPPCSAVRPIIPAVIPSSANTSSPYFFKASNVHQTRILFLLSSNVKRSTTLKFILQRTLGNASLVCFA